MYQPPACLTPHEKSLVRQFMEVRTCSLIDHVVARPVGLDGIATCADGERRCSGGSSWRCWGYTRYLGLAPAPGPPVYRGDCLPGQPSGDGLGIASTTGTAALDRRGRAS